MRVGHAPRTPAAVELTSATIDTYLARSTPSANSGAADKAAWRNGRDLLKLPGVYSIGWKPSTAPDVLEVNTYTDDFAKTLDHFVEDTLVGATLVKQRHPYIKERPPHDPGAPGHEFSMPNSFPMMVSSVLAMPGVIDEGTGGNAMSGFRTSFQASSPAVIERLNPLFRDQWVNDVTTLDVAWTTGRVGAGTPG